MTIHARTPSTSPGAVVLADVRDRADAEHHHRERRGERPREAPVAGDDARDHASTRLKKTGP